MSDFATKADVAAVQAQLTTLQQRLTPLAFTANMADLLSTSWLSIPNTAPEYCAIPFGGTYNAFGLKPLYIRAGQLVIVNTELDVASVGNAGGACVFVGLPFFTTSSGIFSMTWGGPSSPFDMGTCVINQFTFNNGQGPTISVARCAPLPDSAANFWQSGNFINFSGVYVIA